MLADLLERLLTSDVACCRLAEGTRKAVEGWGLKLLCKEKRWNSDSLTVIETPEVRFVCSHPFHTCSLKLKVQRQLPPCTFTSA